jgi:hypothetical protein
VAFFPNPKNCHSPHILASVKDMYVEVGFQLNLYRQPAKRETTVKWKTFSKLWRCYNENNPGKETQECNLNKVFANCSEEEEIFLSPRQRLWKHKKPTANSSIASSAMQY